MKKRILISFIVVIVIGVIGKSQFPKLYVATGYGAKCMASGIFVSGRSAEEVKNNDLDYSIVKYTSHIIDYKERNVTSSFYGFAKQKAVFREGYGCCLIGDSLNNNSDTPYSPPFKKREYAWKKEWPEGDQCCDSVFKDIDKPLLNRALDTAFDPTGVKSKRTAAVVVVYKGKLIGEKYWLEQSITGDTRIWGWSMNKSVLNAMMGVMVRQHKLDIKASAPVEKWLGDQRRLITLNDLLQMSSGLKWNEDYGDLSDVTTMLYRNSNCYAYASSFPYEKEAGSAWKYSSGTTNILSGIIRKTLRNDTTYHQFPYKEIFDKIGMNSMLLETDMSGYFVASSYGYANARDWAKFGQLYLQDGVWKGDSILPKGWVSYSTSSAKMADGKYGAMFWLNRALTLPDVPADMFCCEGHRGQRIFIIPSKQLVVVRLGFAEDHFDYNEFLKSILDAIGNHAGAQIN